MTEENFSMKDMIKGFKFTKLKFPCGFELETTKEIIKDYKKINCPLHGKKCMEIKLRLIGEFKK